MSYTVPETIYVNYTKPTCKCYVYLILISPDIIIQLLERVVTIKLVAMFLSKYKHYIN